MTRYNKLFKKNSTIFVDLIHTFNFSTLLIQGYSEILLHLANFDSLNFYLILIVRSVLSFPTLVCINFNSVVYQLLYQVLRSKYCSICYCYCSKLHHLTVHRSCIKRINLFRGLQHQTNTPTTLIFLSLFNVSRGIDWTIEFYIILRFHWNKLYYYYSYYSTYDDDVDDGY